MPQLLQKRKAISTFILCLFVFVIFHCNTGFAVTMALKTYEKGLKAIKSNDYEMAIELFRKAVSLEPDDKKIRIGMIYYDYAPNEKLRYCIDMLKKHSEEIVEGDEADAEGTEIKKKTRVKIPDFYTTSFAIIIGIDDYENWPLLGYAVNSALAFKQKLEEIGFDQIVTLLDREAVKDRILDELHYNLMGKAGINDLVLVYFAGHSRNEDASKGRKNSYLIPADAPSADVSRAVISIEQLKDISAVIPAKHIFYIIDSCISIPDIRESEDGAQHVIDSFEAMAPEKIVYVITACNAGELIQEANGIDLFTRHLLHAFEGESDINDDGFVLCSELEEYVHTHVSKDSLQKQNPRGGRLEGRGEFFLLERAD